MVRRADEKVIESFGSTYEGLKLQYMAAITPPYALGFGSTYEGLKRYGWMLVLLLQRSFGSTYEGLKRGEQPGGPGHHRAFWQYL